MADQVLGFVVIGFVALGLVLALTTLPGVEELVFVLLAMVGIGVVYSVIQGRPEGSSDCGHARPPEAKFCPTCGAEA